ncbi:MAG: 1-acyl-sn-glycerol-3-phosphate acyltransferase [Elusimicrobia bacterium]|nr:1-acyl-sn-glycerol-3-phosphate acyltransferase [Elusimicrobiota bacterium]
MFKKTADTLFFLIFVYTFYLGLFLVASILEALGRIKVVGRQNLPFVGARGAFIVSNHPSTVEPLFLHALAFPWVFRNPFRYFPWTPGDRRSYYDPWYFWWMRKLRVIPVARNRQGERNDPSALWSMIRTASRGEYVLLFPEGTRTYKAALKQGCHATANGRRLGKLKLGIGMLLVQAQTPCVPIWVDGAERVVPPGRLFPRLWHKITVYIGKPFMADFSSDKEGWQKATQLVTNQLLNLANQAHDK